MKRRLGLGSGWLTLLGMLLAAGATGRGIAAEATKPNVIVFLSDDVGWPELGFQGGKEIPTPNIDAIAKNGVRFTQSYVSGPVCSPTRAGLMTGRYQTRFGHEFNSTGEVSGLAPSEATIADRLKQFGYATIAIGKWHLGKQPEFRPTTRGFDEFYGTLDNTPYLHPLEFVDSRISQAVQVIDDDDFYTTDMYAQRAVEFIDQHQDQPWFLYLPFNAAHSPLQSPKKYLDRFPHVAGRNRQIFAACLSAMDDAVGKVMDKVRQSGAEENTLVFFLSDNGGLPIQNTSINTPLRGHKASTWEGGVRVPFAVQWKGHIQSGQSFDRPIIQLDILPTVVAAAGGTVESSWKLDGVNLLPFLRGEVQGQPHETLYWRLGSQWAIRDGDWKLVHAFNGGDQPGLYNLAEDLSERHNLAEAHPEKVKALLAKWQSWSAEQAPPSVPSHSPIKGLLSGIEF